MITFKIFKKYLVLLIISLILLYVFIVFEKETDSYAFTTNKSLSLSKESIHILKQITKNTGLKFEIYTNENTLIAKKIIKLFKKIKKINPTIQVEFIDPILNPSKVKQNSINMQGEMVLGFIDENKLEKIHITELSESEIINAILRLTQVKDEWLIMAEGYGMMQVSDEGENGLSKFLYFLKKRGVHIARMPLNKSIVFPENVKVIVLPAPTKPLEEEMVSWLEQQMKNGISLWWLTDVGLNKQNNLELALDTIVGDKVKLDKVKYTTTLNEFPQHQITENFNQPLYIAEAIDLLTEGATPIWETHESKSIAVSKQRDNHRLVILGDANFISNQYLQSAANKGMLVRIVDWLFYHDDRLNIPIHINTNTQLFLSNTQLIVLSFTFLIFVPLLFILMAFRKWRKGIAK